MPIAEGFGVVSLKSCLERFQEAGSPRNADFSRIESAMIFEFLFSVVLCVFFARVFLRGAVCDFLL